VVTTYVQFAKLSNPKQDATRESKPTDGPPEDGDDKVTEPLVLSKSGQGDLANSEASDAPEHADGPPKSEDGKVTEPLVLSKPGQGDPDGMLSDAGTAQQSGPFRNVTLQPMGQAILLSGMDLGVTIDLRKIEGEKGTTVLKSDLEVKDEKARVGPLKFEYGGGHFDISGSIDLKEAPKTLKLAGSAGGWKFAEIMRALQFKKGASGVVNANFELSGNHASVQDFFRHDEWQRHGVDEKRQYRFPAAGFGRSGCPSVVVLERQWTQGDHCLRAGAALFFERAS